MKIAPVCLIISVYCAVFTPLAIADQQKASRHMSAEEIFQFSLSRLKESVQKTLRQNDRLTFENNVLRRNISDLQREQEILTQKKAKLSGEGSVFLHTQNGAEMFRGAVDISHRARRTQELIDAFGRDILHLEENIRILEDKLDKSQFETKKKMLLARREEIRKNFDRAEKRLRHLTKKVSSR